MVSFYILICVYFNFLELTWSLYLYMRVLQVASDFVLCVLQVVLPTCAVLGFTFRAFGLRDCFKACNVICFLDFDFSSHVISP